LFHRRVEADAQRRVHHSDGPGSEATLGQGVKERLEQLGCHIAELGLSEALGHRDQPFIFAGTGGATALPCQDLVRLIGPEVPLE
jgi:hypothetical protein